MAQAQSGGSGGGKRKRSNPERQDTRVDFTPMVDMMMLLITFFMFVTTLSKPQIMDIAMPADDKEITDEDKSKVPESKTITLLLGGGDKVYYYFGKPNYKDYASLHETTFSADGGIREILLDRNAEAVKLMIELKREKRDDRSMSEEDFRKKQSEIRNDEETAIVVIKPTEESVYENLVDALDEMAICSIGKYAIVKFDEDADGFLMRNFLTKGEYAAGHGN